MTRCLLAIVLMVGATGFAVRADEYDSLRWRWYELLTGGTNYNAGDPDIAPKLASIASTAQSYWDSLNKSGSRTYLWSDLASTTRSSDINANHGRLRAMAYGYASHGSSLEGNGALLADIISGLDWMYTNRYNETISKYDNWWHWEIGAPMILNDITVLLYDQLTPAQRSSYMTAINKFTPTALTMTGANRTWKATVVGVRGVIVKDSAKIANARDALSNVFLYVTSGDGFYTDGSFIQHSRHPYTGGYGRSLLDSLANLLALLNSSTWDVTDPNGQNVYRWVYNSFEPVIYNGAMPAMVSGREISRSGSQDHVPGHSTIRSILRLTQFAPAEDAAAFKRMVKYWMQADTYRDLIANLPIAMVPPAQAVRDDAGIVPRGELIGHYQFPSMDRVVHLRPGFGLMLSMSSSRIYTYESINTENLHGWYTGDGMTYLYNGDLSQFSKDFWPTVNSYRLPGTTVDTQTRANGTGQSTLSGEHWVGGAALDERYGSAGMELRAWNSTLTARKSWFMFDDEIVAIGAGITSADNRRIETTMENRRLDNTNATFTVDGVTQPTTLGWSHGLANVTWAHLAGSGTNSHIGYYFPQPATVQALRELRTAAWSSINQSYGTSTNLITRRYLTLWFDHGLNPTNASYAYTLLPNKTTAQVAAYAAAPDIVVLTNTPTIQAVRENRLNITAANFWADGSQSTGGITVDQKSAVLYQITTTNLTVAIADPTQTNTTPVTVEIDSPVSALVSIDPGLTLLQTNPTLRLTANLTGARGQTRHTRFALLPTLPVSSVIASADDGNVPANTLDSNLDTRWSALGDGQWIKYNLGTTQHIAAVKIAFYRGNLRLAWFDIEVSNDETNWTQVFSGVSSGTTIQLQTFDFPDTWARWVRIVGHGNSESLWNSFTEVQFVPGPPMTTYAGFQARYFTAEQQTDPTVSGDSADPDGDGLNNLLEYALVLDPLQPSAAQTGPLIVDNHLTITYVKRLAATDLVYRVDISDDLETWDISGSQIEELVLEETPSVQTIQARDLHPVDAHLRRFMHLNVARVP